MSSPRLTSLSGSFSDVGQLELRAGAGSPRAPPGSRPPSAHDALVELRLLPLDVDDARVDDRPGGRNALRLEPPRHGQGARRARARAVQEELARSGTSASANWIAALVANSPLTVRASRRAACSGCSGRAGRRRSRCRGRTSTPTRSRKPAGSSRTSRIRPCRLDEADRGRRRLLGLVAGRGLRLPVRVEEAHAAAAHAHPERPRLRCRTSRPSCRSRTSGSPRCCRGRRGCGTGRTCSRPPRDVPTNSIWFVLPGSPTEGTAGRAGASGRARAASRAGLMAASTRASTESCANTRPSRPRRGARPPGRRCRP